MVGRGAACGRKATGVAGRALVRNGHLAVAPSRRFPARSGMAADAIHRSGHVRSGFACGCIAVVAAGAIGSAVEQAVVRLGARPCTGGFMAVLTNRLPVVNRGCRARCRAKAGAQVASGTLR